MAKQIIDFISMVIKGLVWVFIAHVSFIAKAKGVRPSANPTEQEMIVTRWITKTIFTPVLMYYYKYKNIGTVLSGIKDLNGNPMNIFQLDQFVKYVLGWDTVGLLRFEKGLLILVHGTPDGKVYFRWANEDGNAQIREPKDLFQWSDSFDIWADKYMCSCFNGTKGFYYGQYHLVEPTNTILSFVPIDDGKILVAGMPKWISKAITLR